jgi:hypothetical protein
LTEASRLSIIAGLEPAIHQRMSKVPTASFRIAKRRSIGMTEDLQTICPARIPKSAPWFCDRNARKLLVESIFLRPGLPGRKRSRRTACRIKPFVAGGMPAAGSLPVHNRPLRQEANGRDSVVRPL